MSNATEKRRELEQAFGSAETLQETLEVFKKMKESGYFKKYDLATALIGKARVSFSLGKLDDAKKYMRTAQTIYENEEMDIQFVVGGFEDMLRLYMEMNDHETAISLVRRVIAVPKIPRKLLLEASTRLFSLISLARKEVEAIPYMEEAVEKLKESVGSKHYNVGYSYKKLGAAYIKSGQLELAAKCLTKSKYIMDAARGPDHLESLETSHNLARIYAFMQRIKPAIEIEEKVVEGLKCQGPCVQNLLDEAVELLKILKKINEIMEGSAGPLISVLPHIDVLFANLTR